MIRSIKSELLKFFTTRMWWGMAIAIFVAGGAFAALFTFVVHQGTTGGPGSTRWEPPAAQFPLPHAH